MGFMSGLILKGEDRRVFLAALKATTKPALEHRRMNALLLLDDGVVPGIVARMLFLDERTVAEYRQLYGTRGAAGVSALGYKGNPNRTMPVVEAEALKAKLRTQIFMTSQAVCAWVLESFGHAYTPNAMTKLLKRIGFSYKKPKRFPAKADRAAQAAFLRDVLEPLVAEASEATPLYFMDAVHAQHNSVPAYGWFPKGEETFLKSNAGRTRISINGAFCLHDQGVVQRQDDWINGQSNVALLQAMLDRHPVAKEIRAVADGAPCNHGPDVRDFLAANPRLKLIKLPPYSPNLNLVERLWLLFKKSVVYNKFHATLAEFRSAIDTFFAALPTMKEALASLLTPKFHIFSATPGA
jgi:transposase